MMAKTAVIYWSGTGNTQEMANAVFEGAKAADADSALFAVSETDAASAATYDVLLLGCPAMGAEVLEEDEFEPFFTELESKLAGKKVGLFGSYGWGRRRMDARLGRARQGCRCGACRRRRTHCQRKPR